MQFLDVGPVRMAYRTMGKGPNLVWTPGAWAPGDADPGILELLSERFTVLVYDRPNSGQSDVVFDESPNEWEMAADCLHGLVGKLGMTPLYVAGASGGAMLSLRYAFKYPADVKALFLAWPPLIVWEFWALGAEVRYLQPARTVHEAGAMSALIDRKAEHWLSYDWPVIVNSHPNNKARLLTHDPQRFASTMDRWGNWMKTGRAQVAGLTDEELGTIRIRTAVMPGANGDDYYPESAARILARAVPAAQYMDNAAYLTGVEAAVLSVDQHKDLAVCVARFFGQIEAGA